MKNSILILAVVSTILGTGCSSMRNAEHVSVQYIYAIDSTSSMSESPEAPGTFNKVYDTIKIMASGRFQNGSYKTSYKIIN